MTVVCMFLEGGPLQWPCMQLPMDGNHPMNHIYLGYHTPCIPHIHRLQLETHHRFLLRRSKPPKVPRYLNPSHGNVNQGITKNSNCFSKWYYMFLMILCPFYLGFSKAYTLNSLFSETKLVKSETQFKFMFIGIAHTVFEPL